MNELSVCQALIQQIERIARQYNAPCVDSVELLIGPMSGVDKQVLEQAFQLSKAGTVANLAHMVTRDIPVRVKCRQCKKETIAVPARLVCQKCGSQQVRLISGDELVLASVALNYDKTNAKIRYTVH
jgi:hydrogenase nickel incorporation protein HypA/HybF